jgi:hypothetical protein
MAEATIDRDLRDRGVFDGAGRTTSARGSGAQARRTRSTRPYPLGSVGRHNNDSSLMYGIALVSYAPRGPCMNATMPG